MRIGIFTDLHANLPALNKALAVFDEFECEKIVHVGDLIGIGPHPKETLECALSIPHMEFVMGNHDYWYAHGLPDPLPDYMHPDEAAHQKWVHAQIGKGFHEAVQQWPFALTLDASNGQRLTFVHYALNDQANWFRSFVKNPNGTEIENLFRETKGDIIFYGHDHRPFDYQGNKRYLNLGSAGCFNQPKVRLAVVDCNQDAVKIRKLEIEYDDEGLMEEFDRRNVPAKAFIRKTFITR
jgi:predicted phosphodiesterase